MRVFNKNKTEELTVYDLEKGYLKEDTIVEKVYHEKAEGSEGEFHYITYPNGGRDLIWDKKPIEAKEAYEEEVTNKIYLYIPYDEETLLQKELSDLRAKREAECFTVINRGKLWYDLLTFEQEKELADWYEAWLNVTITKTIPERPVWVDGAINYEEEVL